LKAISQERQLMQQLPLTLESAKELKDTYGTGGMAMNQHPSNPQRN